MRTLLQTVKVELGPLQRLALERIDAEDFGPVAAKVRRDLAKFGVEATDEYLQEGILALKQYYAVAVLDPWNEHAVSDEIDPFWHAHILFTKRYVAFSEEVIGRYLHHLPHDPDDERGMAALDDLYRYTTNLYESLFDYTSPIFHPPVLEMAHLVCKFDAEDRDSALLQESRFAERPLGTPEVVLA